MGITISKDKYPAFTDNAAVSGKRLVTYLNYGGTGTPSKESPNWILLGGVVSNTISLSASTSDSSTKDQGYWNESVITNKQMEYSADMVMKRDNEAQLAIEAFLMDDDITAAKGALDIAIVDLDTKEATRLRIVPTSFETVADSESSIEKNLSAICTGKPEKMVNFVIPE